MDGVHPGGGSRELGQLIDKYGEHLAADLMSEYGVDLRDVLVPGSNVTPRWVFVLIKGLPIDSRFMAEVRGGQQFRGWDEGRYITAAIVDAVRALQYTYVAAHTERKPKALSPYPVPKKAVKPAERTYKPGSFGHTVAGMFHAAREAQQRKAGVADG